MNNNELLNKIKENECYLIGQIPLSDREIKEIIDYAKSIINLNEKYLVIGPDLVLSTALVQVAINDYQDGKYWEILKDKLNIDDISPQRQGILGKIFIETIRKYKLFELEKNPNGTMRYVENIKAHAFVTNNYMEGYYDFLNDYYEKNLFRDITQGVEETLQDLSDYIKKTIKQNIDTIYSSDNNQTKKSYKLLKSTREVIAQSSGDILYQLFYPSLKIIDEKFYDGILPEDLDNRFSQIYIKWIEKEENQKKITSRNKSERKFHSYKPYLTINTSKYIRTPFTLVIPKRRYRKTECDGKVFAKITINGTSRQKELEVSTNMGTYISEELRYPIGYPFDEIKVEIASLDNNITIIPESRYVIFNSQNIRTSRLENGTNYLLVKKDINVDFSDKEKILINKEKFDEWIQYKLDIDENSICYVDSKPLTNIGEFSKEPIYDYKINFFNAYDEKKNKIIAARSHPIISFELDKSKIEGATIQINNKNYSVEKNSSIAIYESPINNSQIIVSADLNRILELKTGYYNVELNLAGESNKKIANYLLLCHVYFLFDKPRYIDEEIAKLTMKTEGLDLKIIDNECKLVYINDYRNNYYYEIDLDSNYKLINAKLNLSEKTFYIEVPIKMMLYGFSEKNLKYGKFDEIWYSKLEQLLYIKFPGAQKLGIYSNIDFNKIVWGEEIKENFYRINITSLISDIKSSDNQWNCLYIKYTDNRARWLEIFKVKKSIRISPYFEFEYYNNIPCFNVEFKEEEGVKIFYSIDEYISHKHIVVHEELKPGINYLPEIKREVYYNIIPTIEENDKFGLNRNVITLPRRKQGIISYVSDKNNYNYINIIGNKLLIEEIKFNDTLLEINKNFKYKIEVESIDDEKNFIGKLYEYEYYAKYNNLNDLSEKSKRYIGNVRIMDIKKLKENKIIFSLENYSKLDEEWYELYYNKKSNKIVENDNKILEVLTSNNVISLEKGITQYEAEIKHRRR